MRRLRHFAGLLPCLLGLLLQDPGHAQGETDEGPRHLRFVEDERGARLETAVVRLTNAEGVAVDLVGAVHIGDAAYYEALNQLFTSYEAVLYELVGKPGEGQPLGDRAAVQQDPRLGLIGGLQAKMKAVLQLESQLEKIDYSPAHFVHADMDQQGFAASQEQSGESFLGLWLKAMRAQAALPKDRASPMSSDAAGLITLLQLLMSRNTADDLKRLIGREFDQVEALMAEMEAGGGTVIIGERNRVALEVLEREIAGGKKKLAVFYGAAHLPDMEQRLLDKGFRTTGGSCWLTAWDIPPPKPKKSAKKKDGEEAGAVKK